MSRLRLVLLITLASIVIVPLKMSGQELARQKSETDSAQAQKKPMSKDQVFGLVQNQLGDEIGAKAIDQRGIDFEPTEDFLQSLKSAGANDAFIQALRSARRMSTPPAAPKKPLTQFQVLSLLVNFVPNARVAKLVAERGLDFEPTEDYLEVVRKNGADDELVSALRQATVTKPPTVDAAAQARNADALNHNARGNELYQKNQFAQAEQEFRAALKSAPEDPSLHSSLAACLVKLSKIDAAVAELLVALRLDPDNEPAHTLLATILLEKGDLKGAVGEFREAVRLDPENDNLHILLGRAQEQNGDRKAGTAEYREALRLNANNDKAHVLLGAALLADNDVEGATFEFGEAVRLNPQEPSYKKAYDALSKMHKGKKKGKG